MIQFELETDRTLFENAFQFAQQQVRALIERDPDYYPIHTEEGKWRHESRSGRTGATDFCRE